jgi:hypothetical protein
VSAATVQYQIARAGANFGPSLGFAILHLIDVITADAGFFPGVRRRLIAASFQ